MSSVKYVQPNSLIANINEKIDELNRKIIPSCTLKHSDQKQNVLQLVGKLKSAVTNILSQLNQNEVDYNTINFDELNDSLEKAYKLLLDEIVLPYEKIDLTSITNRLNKLEDDIKKIPVVPIDLNEKWNTVRDYALSVRDVYGEFEDRFGDLSSLLDPLYFDDVPKLKEDVQQLQQDLETSIDDKRGELDELAGRVSLIEDDSLDNIRSDIDILKDDVIPPLKTDVSNLKSDIGEIKNNAAYFENNVFHGFRDEVSDHYDEFIQLQNDVQKLINEVKKGPSLPFPLNANSDLSTQMTWEECMQTIYFIFSTLHFAGQLIDFGTYTEECQNPDGQVGEAWSSFIVALRNAKTNW